jgi:hypothetical protein
MDNSKDYLPAMSASAAAGGAGAVIQGTDSTGSINSSNVIAALDNLRFNS